MEYDNIRFEKKGPIGVITLNRPRCLNAINFPMRDDLHHCLTKLLEDLDTRVLVVTGEGRGFCAGLDMKDPDIIDPPGGYSPKSAYQRQRSYSDFILLMRAVPQPLIAAVNGAAAGAGLSIALACDIRIAAPEARFAAAYINIGVGGADMGCSWLLPRLVGMGNAAMFMMTGDLVGADRALGMGLIQEVVEKDKLMDRAMELANKLSEKSPLGLRLTKEAIDRNSGGMSLEDAIRLEDRNQAMCIAQLASQAGGKEG